MNSNDKIGKDIHRKYPLRNGHISFSDLNEEQQIKLD